MSFEIQEIDGKLFKIEEIPIDAHNTKRVSHPLTEAEYDKIMASLKRRQDEELGTMEKFRGHDTLKQASEEDERKLRPKEAERGTPVKIKSSISTGGSAAARSKASPKKFGVSKGE